MPSIEKIDDKGAVVGQYELADALVQDRINIGLLHHVVTAELAGHRQGTASAKTRGEVAGTTAKQWKRRAPAAPAWVPARYRSSPEAAWPSRLSPAAMP